VPPHSADDRPRSIDRNKWSKGCQPRAVELQDAALKAKDRVRVYAVNPRYDEIMGVKSYPSSEKRERALLRDQGKPDAAISEYRLTIPARPKKRARAHQFGVALRTAANFSMALRGVEVRLA
jgi:hypothetical protein